ncbi:MAG TPA: tetratricopeptide repeat protein [Terriglobales bacterium]|nr:tetratricopeptide repeat protein [Terriglobales bacterium]
MALLHSFWYEEAEKAFRAIAEKDPKCAMAHWGVAMTNFRPLWYPTDRSTREKMHEELVKAESLKPRTARERDYIAALLTYFRNPERTDHPALMVQYEQAMEKLHQRYPRDKEAAIFYSLALLGTAQAQPPDKSYARQRKAGAILEPLFAAQPDHPGLAHYLIHSYDFPTLAAQGLNAARRYARIAPAVPHALHMPSHIFIRLGIWDDAIASNRASAEAARVYARSRGWEGAWDQQLHAMDYLAYAHLQKGEQGEAERVLDELQGIQTGIPMSITSHYAFAAIPVRLAMESRRWEQTANLQPRADASPWAAAMVHWARAVGAARSGKLEAARQNLATLTALRDQLRQSKVPFWTDQTEVLHLSAAAWVSQAEGKAQEAERLMRAAADLEDSTDKHPVTPGAITPAREMLGDLLLELKRPKEALAEYQASLKNAPNRFNGLYGAARAAEQAGDTSLARTFYNRLLETCGKENTERKELDAARSFIAMR